MTSITFLRNILFIVFFTFFLNGNINAEDTLKNSVNLIVASSPTGEYIVGMTIASKESVLIDVKQKKVKAYLPKDIAKYFCIWSSDTTFFYAAEKNGKITYYQYFVSEGISKRVVEVEENIAKTLENASLIKAPNFIPKNSRLFVLFVSEGKIGIYYPIDNEIIYIYNLKDVIGDNYLKSIAIDTRCENIVMTIVSKNDETGSIIELNIKNGNTKKIEQSKFIINDSYVYFLNDDSSIVYFRYMTLNNIEVVRKDLFSDTEKVLHIFYSIAPSYVVDVPFKKSILVSGIDIKTEIEVEKNKNNIIEDIIGELLNRFKIINISYK